VVQYITMICFHLNSKISEFSVVQSAWSYKIYSGYSFAWEPWSSVSIVSDYGLDDRTIEVRPRQRREDFSSKFCVQNACGAHPTSCAMGTRGPFPGGKARPGRDADHSSPSSAEVMNE
jgi:hypothetical protein